ncbi:MAG: hypothetical protein ABIN25_09260 [Ginsengibacter sp.]
MYLIEDADEKLTGLLIALATQYNAPEEEYTPDEIESFYEIRDELVKNFEKGSTVEEAHQRIRNKSQDAF